jgi:hypothetical protein
MGGEPGDHRKAEPVHVIGELAQIGTTDAGIDQDQPTLPAHHDGIAPHPLALPDPDAVSHLMQHRFTLSGVSARREARRTSGPASGPAGVPPKRTLKPRSARDAHRAAGHVVGCVAVAIVIMRFAVSGWSR